MNTKTHLRKACCAFIALSALAVAQTAPVTPATSAESETVKLTEFTVKAEPNRGYAASETLTGSRVRTQIAELPYTVNVITSEFFEDFGIFEFSDNLIQVGGFTGLDVGGGFNLRGFGSTSQLRDGFFRLGRYGSSNVDRIEIIKGNNAAIYGRTSPGGMMNMVSKQPRAKESQRLSVNYGNEGTQRGTLETAGPVARTALGSTNYIFTASHFQKEFDMEYARNRNQEYYLARRWDYNQNNSWGTININPPANATTGIVPPVTSTRGAVPNTTRIIEDGGGLQADLLAQYKTNRGKIEHKTLVTLDINDYYRWDPSLNYANPSHPNLVAWNAAGSGRVVTLDANLNPTSPITYFTAPLDPTIGVKTRHQKRRITVIGGLLRQQSSLMEGRLLTFAGLRFDSVRFRDRDFIGFAPTATAPIPYITGSMIDRTINLTKPNLGFNYKLTPNLRVYGSYSESYFVSQNDNAAQHYDPTFKPEVADGYDYGFKGSFFEDRLNFTVSGYYANRYNVSVTNLVETPIGSGSFVQVNEREGDQLVRGYEIDVTYKVSNEVSTGGSWGHVYSIYTDFGEANPAAIGRRVNGISPQNGSVYVKYEPKGGALNNFSFNVSVSHLARTPTEAPNAGDTYSTSATGVRTVTRSTRQYALSTPSFTLWSVGARYKLSRVGNYDHTFAVNINNLFDKEYLRVNRLIGEKQAILFTYTLNRSGSRR